MCSAVLCSVVHDILLKGVGSRNNNFEVWGKDVVLPMQGKVVTAVEKVPSYPQFSTICTQGS